MDLLSADRLREADGCVRTRPTRCQSMTATDTTRAADKGAPTMAPTHYDARDVLAGRLDDTTVRQAVIGR